MENKVHILIVDDDNRIRDLLKEYLNSNGYIVSSAVNAEEAKLKITHLRFDIIVPVSYTHLTLPTKRIV